jgi:hypothetical protein
MDPDAHRMFSILTAEDYEPASYFPGEEEELELLNMAYGYYVMHTAKILDYCKREARKTFAKQTKAEIVCQEQFSLVMKCVDYMHGFPSTDLVRRELQKKYTVSPQAALELAKIIRSSASYRECLSEFREN